MMKKISVRVGIIVVLFILVVLILSIYIILSIDYSGVNSSVVLSAVTIMVTFSGYFINRSFERKKLIEQQIRERKLPIYEEFISFFMKYLMNPDQINNDDLVKKIQDLNQKAMIWMSDSSLSAYINFISKLREQDFEKYDEEGIRAITNIIRFEMLVLEFRKDIGHSNKNFHRGRLSSLYINDLHKYNLDKLVP